MLYERYAKRRFQEGRELARAERDEEWLSWLKRRDEALAVGKEFDEPSPSGKVYSNGQ